MNELYLKPSHRVVPVAMLGSATLSADAVHTVEGNVDMGAFHQAMFAATVGLLGDGGSATAELVQSTTVTFDDAKPLEGRSPVTILEDAPLILQARSGELDINNGFRYLRAQITTAGGTLNAGMLAFGLDPRDSPALPLSGAVID